MYYVPLLLFGTPIMRNSALEAECGQRKSYALGFELFPGIPGSLRHAIPVKIIVINVTLEMSPQPSGNTQVALHEVTNRMKN